MRYATQKTTGIDTRTAAPIALPNSATQAAAMAAVMIPASKFMPQSVPQNRGGA